MIQQLSIAGIRNITSAFIEPSSSINIIYGHNGSGKTSVLESIYMLSVARSYRTPRIKAVINRDLKECTVFGRLRGASGLVPIGVSRSLDEDGLRIRVAGRNVQATSDLAKHLPLQVINPESFLLLEGSPKVRRKFLDWVVFHVKHHEFYPLWKRMKKALKQRNKLIRYSADQRNEIKSWSNEFEKSANAIDLLRKEHVRLLVPMFTNILAQLTDLEDVSIQYYSGWDEEKSLKDVLVDGLNRDVKMGYTQFGPHRADLRVRVGKSSAIDVLSRGQLKLVICALKLAQGFLYKKLSNKQCVYLIDDLSSELDIYHREKLCNILQKMNCQTFITCVDKQILSNCWMPYTDIKLFHVKHGQIAPKEL